MKKSFLSMALVGAITLMSGCGSASSMFSPMAQGQGAPAAQTPAAAPASDGLSSGLERLLGSLLGGSSLKQADIVGTWTFKSADCVFETENFLMKAGGEMAAAKVEEKINNTLAKVGVGAGQLSFTFNQDNTYTATVMGRTIQGNYTLDLENKKLTFTYLNGLGTISPQVAKTGNTLSLLYDADKLLKFLVTVSAKSSNSTLTTLSTLMSSYDGMLLGMELQK